MEVGERYTDHSRQYSVNRIMYIHPARRCRGTYISTCILHMPEYIPPHTTPTLPQSTHSHPPCLSSPSCSHSCKGYTLRFVVCTHQRCLGRMNHSSSLLIVPIQTVLYTYHDSQVSQSLREEAVWSGLCTVLYCTVWGHRVRRFLSISLERSEYRRIAASHRGIDGSTAGRRRYQRCQRRHYSLIRVYTYTVYSIYNHHFNLATLPSSLSLSLFFPITSTELHLPPQLLPPQLGPRITQISNPFPSHPPIPSTLLAPSPPPSSPPQLDPSHHVPLTSQHISISNRDNPIPSHGP